MICSGQIDRDAAVAELRQPPYAEPTQLEQDRTFVLKKLGFDEHEWQALMESPIHTATDYPTNDFWFTRLGRFKDRFRAFATRP
jgi:hypothetical protein